VSLQKGFFLASANKTKFNFAAAERLYMKAIR
jgi:hypothetical protein